MFKQGDRVQIVAAEHFRYGQIGTIAGPQVDGHWPVNVPPSEWSSLFKTADLRKA